MTTDITELRLDLIPLHEDREDGRPLPFIDLTVELPPDDFLFDRAGHGLLDRATMNTVKGKMKVGKSAFGLVIMAAALGGECVGIKPRRDDLAVLWIDTEQDVRTVQRKGKAVLRMAGLDETIMPDRLKVLSLRGWGSPAELLDATVQAIEETRPDLVFLDGVADICAAFNDEEQSRETVGRLDAVAARTGATIVGLIHTNKNDNNARGHLGAALEHKSSEVYEVEKSDKNVATVKQAVSRFGEVPPFSFAFQDDFTLTAVEDPDPDDDIDKLKRDLDEKFRPLFRDGDGNLDAGICYSYTDLWKAYKDYHQKSEPTGKKAINQATRLGVLKRRQESRKITYTLTSLELLEELRNEDPI